MCSIVCSNRLMSTCTVCIHFLFLPHALIVTVHIPYYNNYISTTAHVHLHLQLYLLDSLIYMVLSTAFTMR